MRVARGVFISSALFGIAVAVVYWFSSHHPGGTLLLGLMGIAMVFVATFMFVAQREANLAGDRKNANYKEAAGEDLGIFTLATVWPLVAAVAILAVIVGALFSPFVAAVGFVVFLLVLWRLGRESNRT